MTKRLKLLIGVNFALLALITLSLQQSKLHSTLEVDNQAFAVLDTSIVSKIVLGGNVLQRKSASQWEINGQYAIQPERANALLGLLRMIEIKRPAPNSALKQILDTLARKPFEVSVFSGSEELQRWQLAGIGDESYGKRSDIDVVYSLYVPGYRVDLAKWLSEPADEWRDKRVLYTSFASMQGLEIEKEGKKILSIGFNKNFYAVESVQQLDSMALYNYIVQYSAYRADAYLQKVDKSSSIFQTKPIFTFKVADMADGSTPKVMEVYSRNDTLYGWLPNSQEAVLLPGNTIERLALPYQAFEKKNNP